MTCAKGTRLIFVDTHEVHGEDETTDTPRFMYENLVRLTTGVEGVHVQKRTLNTGDVLVTLVVDRDDVSETARATLDENVGEGVVDAFIDTSVHALRVTAAPECKTWAELGGMLFAGAGPTGKPVLDLLASEMILLREFARGVGITPEIMVSRTPEQAAEELVRCGPTHTVPARHVLSWLRRRRRVHGFAVTFGCSVAELAAEIVDTALLAPSFVAPFEPMQPRVLITKKTFMQKDAFYRMVLEFHMSFSSEVAARVAVKYPTFASLMHALEDADDQAERLDALSEAIDVDPTKSSFSRPALVRLVQNFYDGDDAGEAPKRKRKKKQ